MGKLESGNTSNSRAIMCAMEAPRNTRGKRLAHAFTLAEVMISLAVMSVAFGGILLAYIRSARQAQWAGYSLAAESIGIQIIEQARAAVWDPSFNPPKNELMNLNLNGWTWTASAQGGGTGTGTGWTTNILDVPLSATNNVVIATNFVTITCFYENGNNSPPVLLQMVRVDTVWSAVGFGGNRIFTNRTATYYGMDNRDVTTLF